MVIASLPRWIELLTWNNNSSHVEKTTSAEPCYKFNDAMCTVFFFGKEAICTVFKLSDPVK